MITVKAKGGVDVTLRTLLMCSVDSLHGIMTGVYARSLMKLGSTSDIRMYFHSAAMLNKGHYVLWK